MGWAVESNTKCVHGLGGLGEGGTALRNRGAAHDAELGGPVKGGVNNEVIARDRTKWEEGRGRLRLGVRDYFVGSRVEPALGRSERQSPTTGNQRNSAPRGQELNRSDGGDGLEGVQWDSGDVMLRRDKTCWGWCWLQIRGTAVIARLDGSIDLATSGFAALVCAWSFPPKCPFDTRFFSPLAKIDPSIHPSIPSSKN